jgi:hypothetical protein
MFLGNVADLVVFRLTACLFFKSVGNKRNSNKYSFNILMQYITKGKFISFCCKDLYVTLCTVVACLLRLYSAQQFCFSHQSDRTPDTVKCSAHVTQADILLTSLCYF